MRERIRLALWAVALSALAMVGPATADDVSTSEQILCTVQSAAACSPDGSCTTGSPIDWNVPAFVVVDLAAQTLATTSADERPRATPIKHLERSESAVVAQGFENGRAFSIVVETATGAMSASVSMIERNVSVFGACTPLPVLPAGSD